MKFIFTSLIVCLILSSCATHLSPNAIEQQGMQTEIDESELRQLLNVSEEELEIYKTNFITVQGAESWSDWKKSINYLKEYQGQEYQEYWNDLSITIKTSTTPVDDLIDDAEMRSVLHISQQEFNNYKSHVIRELGEEGWKGEKRGVYYLNTLKDREVRLKEVTDLIKNILSKIAETNQQGNSSKQTSASKISSEDSDLKKELDQAKELLKEGLITKEEYEAQRKKILSNYY